MQKIDKEAYQKRLDRITELFADMMVHADEQSTYRCPYKNRFDECTAKFGCRNQRRPEEKGELLNCGGDDKIDYRPAWQEDQRPIPSDAVAGNGYGMQLTAGDDVILPGAVVDPCASPATLQA